MQRLLDILFSACSLIILSPLFLLIAIVLRLTGEGEIFFRQRRVGRGGAKFDLLKFATMLKDSPNMAGGVITTKNDSRITPMGSFLRNTKINELPQLFNILFGQMSVVGPRPVMKISFEAYPDNVKKVIYDVKPGLTGIGSIIFRDEEELITNVKNKGGDIHEFYINKIYPFKGELEIWYQNHKSFILDMKIIFVTAWVIFVPASKLYEKWFKDLPKRNF